MSCINYAGNESLLNKMTNLNSIFLGGTVDGMARCRGLNFLIAKSQLNKSN
jgi:hypothetical protein